MNNIPASVAPTRNEVVRTGGSGALGRRPISDFAPPGRTTKVFTVAAQKWHEPALFQAGCANRFPPIFVHARSSKLRGLRVVLHARQRRLSTPFQEEICC